MELHFYTLYDQFECINLRESLSKSPALLKPTTSKYVLDISWTGMCALVWTIWRQRIDWRLSNLYRPCWPHCWFDRHLKIGQQSKINILTLFWFIFVSIAMYILPHCYWLNVHGFQIRLSSLPSSYHVLFSSKDGKDANQIWESLVFYQKTKYFPGFFCARFPNFLRSGQNMVCKFERQRRLFNEAEQHRCTDWTRALLSSRSAPEQPSYS